MTKRNPAVNITPSKGTPLEQITTPSTTASMSPSNNDKPKSDHSRLLFALDDDSRIPSSPQRRLHNENDDIVPANDACIILQSHIRTHLVRKRYKASLQAIVILQRWFLLLLSLRQQEQPSMVTKETDNLQHEQFVIPVMKLQALVRGVLQRQRRATGVQESQTFRDEPTVDPCTTNHTDVDTMAVVPTIMSTPTNDAAGVASVVSIDEIGIPLEMDNDKGGDNGNPTSEDDCFTKSSPDKEGCASGIVLPEGAVVPVIQSESADHKHGDFDQVSSTTGSDLGTTSILGSETSHVVATNTGTPSQLISEEITVSSQAQNALNVDNDVEGTVYIKNLDTPAESAVLIDQNGPDNGQESDHVQAVHCEKRGDDSRVPSDLTDAEIQDPSNGDTNISDDCSLENIWSIVAATPMRDSTIDQHPKRSARSQVTPESTALAIGFFKQDHKTAVGKDDAAAADQVDAGSSVEQDVPLCSATTDTEVHGETADAPLGVESKTIPDGLLERRDVSAHSEICLVPTGTEQLIETSASEGVPSSVLLTADKNVPSPCAHEDNNESPTSTECSAAPLVPSEEEDHGVSPTLSIDKVALNVAESPAETPTDVGTPIVLQVNHENNESVKEGQAMPLGERSDLPLALAEAADQDVSPVLADDCVILNRTESAAETRAPSVVPTTHENKEFATEAQVMPLGERSDLPLTPAEGGGQDGSLADTPSDEGTPIALPANDENKESPHEGHVTPLVERSVLPLAVAEELPLVPAEELDEDADPALLDDGVVLNVTESAAETPTEVGTPIVLPANDENNESTNESQVMPLVERSDSPFTPTDEADQDANPAPSDDCVVLRGSASPAETLDDERGESAVETPYDNGAPLVLPTTHEREASACANEKHESPDEENEVADPSISTISSKVVASCEIEEEIASNQRNTGRSVQFSPDTPTTTKATKSPIVSGRKSPKSPLQSLISRFDAGGSAFKTGLIYPPSAPTLSNQSPGVDSRHLNVQGSVQSKNDNAEAEIAKLRHLLQEQQRAEQQKIEEHRLEREKVEKRNRELEEQLANLKIAMEVKEAERLESVGTVGNETLGSSLEVPVPPAPTKEEGAKPEGNEIQSTQISRTTTPEQQQTLMEESGRMLEYLRREVVRLRKENTALKGDLDSVSENTQRLMEANSMAQESFSSLSETAKEQRIKAQTALAGYKQQIHDLKLAQEEMNDVITMKQAAYIAEVRSKKLLEAGMSRVVDLIQEKCRDSRLVEQVLQISDEVEEQQHLDPDDNISVSLAAPPEEVKQSDSMVGRFASFFSSS